MLNLYQKKHKDFFLLLRTASQKKQKFFIYPLKNEQLLIVLKKLQEKSLILGYFIKSSTIQVFLRYDHHNLSAINHIFLFPKFRYVSLKKLKAFENDHPFSLSLLNTQFGILDTKECQKKNCGGEFIVTIF